MDDAGLLSPKRMRDRVPESIGAAADALAKHLSLLFVPAGVGVMMYFGRLAGEWLPIATALLVSTVLAIAAAALTFTALTRRIRAPADKRDRPTS